MLVLSRKTDERIMIGDDIVLTIVDIRGDKVRLGIEAPREVPVHRQEVYDAIQREKFDEDKRIAELEKMANTPVDEMVDTPVDKKSSQSGESQLGDYPNIIQYHILSQNILGNYDIGIGRGLARSFKKDFSEYIKGYM